MLEVQTSALRGFDNHLPFTVPSTRSQAWRIDTGPRGTKITVRLPLEPRPPSPPAAGDG